MYLKVFAFSHMLFFYWLQIVINDNIIQTLIYLLQFLYRL